MHKFIDLCLQLTLSRAFVVLGLLLVLTSPFGWAQSTQGAIVGSVNAATTVHGNMHCSRMMDNLVGGQNSVCTVSK